MLSFHIMPKHSLTLVPKDKHKSLFISDYYRNLYWLAKNKCYATVSSSRSIKSSHSIILVICQVG